MPKRKVLHYNPKETHGVTRCGKKLAKVEWTEDKADVTCNMCNRLIKKDRELDLERKQR